MDPLSITVAVVSLSKLCKTVMSTVREVLERMRKSKKVLLDLLDETERVRLLLESVRELALQLQRQKKTGVLFDIHLNECERTILELQSFATVLAVRGRSSQIWRAITWNQYEAKAEILLAHLRVQEEHINSVLTLTAAKSTINVEAQMSELLSRLSVESTIVDTFGSISVVDNQDKPIQVNLPKSNEIPIWFGYTLAEGFSHDYLDARHALSEAAYWGDWESLREQWEEGKNDYGENWINCSRLKSPQMAPGLTLWAPIHQAVYNCATFDEIRSMIEKGALRTLRTRKADEFTHDNLTALEIAQELGRTHLYDILSPIIHHPLPRPVLEAIEQRFHHLIHTDLETYSFSEYLHLPSLDVLTELENPEMWFPLPPLQFQMQSKIGYQFRLDGRSLLVSRRGLMGRESVQYYRIYENERVEIEQAIAFKM